MGEAAKKLGVRADATLGSLVVNGERRRTPYRFNKDSAWPMKSACTGAWLESWPIAVPVDKNKLVGVSPKLIGTFKRPDGRTQLTIDCWPVYTFAGDLNPGDTKGQGKQGLWFAVSPQRKKVGAGAPV